MAKRKSASRGPAPGDYSRVIRRSDLNSTGGSFFDPNRRLPRAYKAERRLPEPLERLLTDQLIPYPYNPVTDRSYPPLFQSSRPPRVHLPPVNYGRKLKALPTARQFRSLKALHTPEAYRAKHCLDRKQRREVLFAYGRAGLSGKQIGKRYRRTASSTYSC